MHGAAGVEELFVGGCMHTGVYRVMQCTTVGVAVDGALALWVSGCTAPRHVTQAIWEAKLCTASSSILWCLLSVPDNIAGPSRGVEPL
jgi:hypothetical protein